MRQFLILALLSLASVVMAQPGGQPQPATTVPTCQSPLPLTCPQTGGYVCWQSTDVIARCLNNVWTSHQVGAANLGANYVWTGNHDFGDGTIEIQNGTALPGSCTVGQLFLDTDATAGQQLYACEGGTFVLQGGAPGGVMPADFDANTILKADSDDTPVALTVAEQRIVGRVTSGNIEALTRDQVLQATERDGWYNVAAANYGATTASSDNTPQFKTAIGAAISNGGGTIYIPPGTWNLGEDGTNNYALLFSGACDNITIEGAGAGVTILRAMAAGILDDGGSGSNEHVLYFQNCDNVRVRNLTIQQETTSTWDNAIRFDGGTGNVVENVVAGPSGNVFELHALTFRFYDDVTDVCSIDSRATGVIGRGEQTSFMSFADGATCKNQRVHFRDIIGTDASTFYGIEVRDTLEWSVTDSVFYGNQFGVLLEDIVTNGLLASNVIADNTSHGVVINDFDNSSSQPVDVLLANNVIHANGGGGVRCLGAARISLVGNFIEGSTGNGYTEVSGDACNNNNFISNIVRNNGSDGFEIYGDDHVWQGNIIQANASETGINLTNSAERATVRGGLIDNITSPDAGDKADIRVAQNFVLNNHDISGDSLGYIVTPINRIPLNTFIPALQAGVAQNTAIDQAREIVTDADALSPGRKVKRAKTTSGTDTEDLFTLRINALHELRPFGNFAVCARVKSEEGAGDDVTLRWRNGGAFDSATDTTITSAATNEWTVICQQLDWEADIANTINATCPDDPDDFCTGGGWDGTDGFDPVTGAAPSNGTCLTTLSVCQHALLGLRVDSDDADNVLFDGIWIRTDTPNIYMNNNALLVDTDLDGNKEYDYAYGNLGAYPDNADCDGVDDPHDCCTGLNTGCNGATGYAVLGNTIRMVNAESGLNSTVSYGAPEYPSVECTASGTPWACCGATPGTGCQQAQNWWRFDTTAPGTALTMGPALSSYDTNVDILLRMKGTGRFQIDNFATSCGAIGTDSEGWFTCNPGSFATVTGANAASQMACFTANDDEIQACGTSSNPVTMSWSANVFTMDFANAVDQTLRLSNSLGGGISLVIDESATPIWTLRDSDTGAADSDDFWLEIVSSGTDDASAVFSSLDSTAKTEWMRYDAPGGAMEVNVPLEFHTATQPTTVAEGQAVYDDDDHCLEMTDGTDDYLTACKLHQFSVTIIDPDGAQGKIADITVFPVEAETYPNGVVLVDLGIKTDVSSTYSVNFENWDSPNDATPGTIEAVATSASLEAEDDGTLDPTEKILAAGQILKVDIPAATSGVSELVVWGTYWVRDNN